MSIGDSDDTEDGSKSEDKGKMKIPGTPTKKDWLTEVRETKPQGFLSHILTSSLYVNNFEWGKAFWTTDKDKTGSAGLAVKSKDGASGWANLWFLGTIGQVFIRSAGDFRTWTVKLMLNEDSHVSLIENLRKYGKFRTSDELEGLSSLPLTISAKVDAVREQLSWMDEGMERDLLIDTLDKGAYPLAYDGVTDPNPDPGFDAGKFAKGDFVAVEAQIGTWDFERDGKRIKRYVLKMQSLYLVKDPRPKDPISTPQKRRRGPNEWVMSPPRTKSTKFGASPFETPFSQ